MAYVENEKSRNRCFSLIRKRYWSENNGEWLDESKFAAIAVPVLFDGEILGTLRMVYLKKAARYFASNPE